jgi:hypothetical protein
MDAQYVPYVKKSARASAISQGKVR